ncbi:MAG: 50S ribosome-binding GTPase, partial [Planctomycetales bacterium]|nr:50S ribosome-binding GTPase [Planctomycetales bacterium]
MTESSNTTSPEIPAEPNGSIMDRFQEALRSVRNAVDKYKDCSDEEKAKLRKDLDQLQDMEQKLTQGRVEIVLFGEISTGKSALINALVGEHVADVNVQGGWTKEAKTVPWTETDYVLPGIDDSRLVIVDTPGINEVGDTDHDALAKHAARRGDIILFVTDSDLNEVEFSAIIALAAVHKPILVVLNKKDLYSDDDMNQLVHITRNERLKGIVPPENVVCTAADPREIEYVAEDERGRETSEWRKPQPDVTDLKARILQILDRDGLALVALNAAMYAADKTDRIAKLRIELREEQAEQLIWRFATIKALVVALNPVAGV